MRMVTKLMPRHCDCGQVACFRHHDSDIATHCRRHRQPGMLCTIHVPTFTPPRGAFRVPVKVTPPTCKHVNCANAPRFGLTKAEYCNEHKNPAMCDYGMHECVECHDFNRTSEEGKCRYCRQLYTKQKAIRLWLLQNGYKIDLCDSVVDGDFSNERPDFLFYCDGYVLVLEVDEKQHKYEPCDVIRMKNMSQVLGEPTIFIRYNPDMYDPSRFFAPDTFEERTAILKQILDKYLNLRVKPETASKDLPGYCCALYLFFDYYYTGRDWLEVITKWDC